MATILEKELEDLLFESPEIARDQVGLYGKCFRQVNIEGYGVIDLLYVDFSPGVKYPDVEIIIVELKKDKIDLTAVGQICRYKRALDRFFKNRLSRFNWELRRNVTVRGVLIGNGTAHGDVCYVIDSMDWLSCYHYDLSLKTGISFEESSGWYSKAENFSTLDELKKTLAKDYLELYKHLTRSQREIIVVE